MSTIQLESISLTDKVLFKLAQDKEGGILNWGIFSKAGKQALELMKKYDLIKTDKILFITTANLTAKGQQVIASGGVQNYLNTLSAS